MKRFIYSTVLMSFYSLFLGLRGNMCKLLQFLLVQKSQVVAVENQIWQKVFFFI